MNSELFITAARLAFYSVQGTRGKAITNFFETGNSRWNNKGELESSYVCPELNAAILKLEMGFKPNWLQVAEEEAWEFSYSDKRFSRDTEQEKEESFKWILKDYINQEEWPKVFHLTKYDHNIFNVPNNVSADWLNICFEYCHAILNAKTDFDSTSILNSKDIECRNKIWNIRLKSNVENTLADELVQIIVQSGIVPAENIETLNKLKMDFNQTHFNNEYRSAGVNANQSNQENTQAQKLVREIVLPKLNQLLRNSERYIDETLHRKTK